MPYSIEDLKMKEFYQKIFEADKNGNINTFRQNLQATYVSRVIEIMSGKNSNRFKIPVKSMAIYNLEKILKKINKTK